MKQLLLHFEGYWLDAYKTEIPQEAGIYCVYACEPMALGKIAVLREIIYIGASDHVGMSIVSMDEERRREWETQLREGETLCYSFAAADEADISCALSAMVHHHRPICNRVEGDFGFADTKVEIIGEHELLDESFVICCQEQAMAQ